MIQAIHSTRKAALFWPVVLLLLIHCNLKLKNCFQQDLCQNPQLLIRYLYWTKYMYEHILQRIQAKKKNNDNNIMQYYIIKRNLLNYKLLCGTSVSNLFLINCGQTSHHVGKHPEWQTGGIKHRPSLESLCNHKKDEGWLLSIS